MLQSFLKREEEKREPSPRQAIATNDSPAAIDDNFLVEDSSLQEYPLPDYRTRHGWRKAGLVESMSEELAYNAAALDELEFEGSCTAELGKVDSLRAALLTRRGLSTAPTKGWHAQHYSRARLLHFLRAKGGKVDTHSNT